jgi:hypothetical protein
MLVSFLRFSGLEQAGELVRRICAKAAIDRSEDRKWTFALESGHEAGLRQGLGQRVELAGFDGNFDDVLVATDDFSRLALRASAALGVRKTHQDAGGRDRVQDVVHCDSLGCLGRAESLGSNAKDTRAEARFSGASDIRRRLNDEALQAAGKRVALRNEPARLLQRPARSSPTQRPWRRRCARSGAGRRSRPRPRGGPSRRVGR